MRTSGNFSIKKGFAQLLVMSIIFAVLIISVSVAVFYKTNKVYENQDLQTSPPSPALVKSSTAPASNIPNSKNLFVNTEFKYSLEIPSNFTKESDKASQVRFRSYTEKGRSIDGKGSFDSEIQILTLRYDDPAVNKEKNDAEIKRIFDTPKNTYIEIENNKVLKVKNLDLDVCKAVQLYGVAYDTTYTTACYGKNAFLSIILKADSEEVAKKYLSDYEMLIQTFKFNGYSL